MMSIWDHKPVRELRRFGFSFGAALTLLGSLLLWKDRPAAPWVLGVAAVILVLAALLPRALAPLELVLSKIALAVASALTFVILTVTFILVITPIGLFMRLLGRDPLHLKLDPDRASYWVDVDADGPSSRPERPF